MLQDKSFLKYWTTTRKDGISILYLKFISQLNFFNRSISSNY